MRVVPILTAIVLVGAGVATWYWAKEPVTSTAGLQRLNKSKGGPQRGGGDTPVPVVVTEAARQTVAVYRDGIGTVQSLAAVTVRAQVDGRLISVDFVEGQTVHKGDVLARIDPRVPQAAYDQAVAKKAQDEATLLNARLDLKRYQQLAASNAGPKQQADQQAATVAQLEAQVKSDTAAIDNAKAILDYTTITSPIDGRIGLRGVDPGNIVHASDSGGVVLITQMQPMAVVFTLPQRDLAAVAAALSRKGPAGSMPVPVEALDQEGGGVLSRGALATVDNQIDVTTGTIKLKAIFPNDDLKLWPGQFVSTRVAVDSLVDATVVPTPAIRRGPKGTFVYVVDADDRAKVRPVKVTLQDDARAVLGDGIEVGERVVTIGFAQLADGKPVIVTGASGDPASASATGGPGAADGAAAPDRRRGEGKRGEGKRGEGKRGGKRDGEGPRDGDGRRRDEAATAKPG